MGKTAANISIGECDIYFDNHNGTGERDLGHTRGGAKLSFEREFAELLCDKFGNMPIDLALTGQNLKVTCRLVERTTQNLGLAIAEGDYDANGSDSKLGLGTDSGKLMSTVAGQLRLHPRKNASTDRDDDIYIFKAVSVENVETEYKIDEQRVLEVTFRALVDESYENGTRLGRIGDVAIS